MGIANLNEFQNTTSPVWTGFEGRDIFFIRAATAADKDAALGEAIVVCGGDALLETVSTKMGLEAFVQRHRAVAMGGGTWVIPENVVTIEPAPVFWQARGYASLVGLKKGHWMVSKAGAAELQARVDAVLAGRSDAQLQPVLEPGR
jgi:hypothetical protein